MKFLVVDKVPEEPKPAREPRRPAAPVEPPEAREEPRPERGVSRLHVYSALISSRDPDRLDVTRKTGGPEGAAYAPSWGILRPVLEARRVHDAIMERAVAAVKSEMEDEWALARDAEVVLDCAWSAYVPAYLAEMRASYRVHRAAWDRLLARSRVVLVCYCTDPDRCHRAILRSRILPALGAVDCGEVGA